MAEQAEIHVLDHKVKLLQPPGGFRTSLDSVMVAAACPVKPGERVIDLGCGVGGASFCLAWRVPEALITGIDIQPEYIDLAQKNITLNNKTDRVEFMVVDVRDYKIADPADRFDHVMCNPPYLEAGTYTPSPDTGRAIALGHGVGHDPAGETGLEDWLDAGFHFLRPGGSLTMIHRADMTARIIQGLGRRFGDAEVIPLWPRAGEPAKRVVIRARKDRKGPAIIHPGLVIHNPGRDHSGGYTPQAEAILRDGAGLFLP